MADTAKPEAGPRRWLVVMAKAPRCGAVKTRLARDIGEVAATGFARHTLANICRRLARDPRWRMRLAVSPDSAVASGFWPAGVPLIPQGSGDLGARMQLVFDSLPPGPAVIIGADIPQISAPRIAAAFRLLGAHDAVFGPAQDGGYWLVGLRRSPRVPAIFSKVRWSSAHTLKDTLANLGARRSAFVATLGDVDDGESHRRLGPAGARLML